MAAVTRRNLRESQSRFQIGLGRSLDKPIVIAPTSVPAGQWTSLSNGWKSLSVEVSSAGALGLRLHLESVSLPPGARLVIYNPADPSPDPSPITSTTLAGKREVWTGTIFSERAVVEAQLPPGADTKALAFTVTGLSHIFALPVPTATTDPGPCEVDATCYPQYALQASGVARMSYVSGGDTLVCSGCLLAPGNPSDTSDYFLTAHHCVGDQDEASTIELFWFYQTSTCNGTPPDLSTVPTTQGGADLLATSSVNDFTFLRLREVPPSGAYHLPWSTNAPSTNETLVGLHHPGGSFTRISIGQLDGEDADFWAVQWSVGVTEPGASGSPLLNGNLEVIGQLFGGFEGGSGSSCGAPTVPDAYGRFDVSYSSLEEWLGANSVTNPFTPEKGTFNGLFFDTVNGVSVQSAGYFTVTEDTKGRFSGRLELGPTRYSLSGQFDSGGNAQFPLGHGKQVPLEVELQVDPSDSDHITGTVSGDTWTSQLDGDRAVFNSRTNIAPEAGQFTLIIPGNPDDTNSPGGDSYADVTVSKSGAISMSGSLADDTGVSQSATVSQAARWPFYLSLYSGQGLVLGWLTFTNSDPPELGGDVTWIKPELEKAKYYPGGFSNQIAVAASAYTRPPRDTTILDFSSSTELVVSGADLAQAITNQIMVEDNNRVLNLSSNRMSLSFSTSSGLFSGYVVEPGTSERVSFRGATLQSQNAASGYFLSSGQSGEVLISP
jgi:hypothetical protein